MLHVVETVGNALPHPASLFALMAVLMIFISGVAAALDWSAVHPATGETIHPWSLLSVEGLHRMLDEMVTNFTAFAPLGTVLVAMLGIGVAERSGLIAALLRLLVLSSPRKLLTFVIVLSGILSNTASEVGYVLLVPLGAMIFQAMGRHPIGGLAAAFAGVSGGYSANLLLGTIDPLLAGLSQEAAHIVSPGYVVNPACNYYFMAASTFIIALTGTWVTEKWVMPRLGTYAGDAAAPDHSAAVEPLSAAEKRGLILSAAATTLLVAVLLWGVVPADGFLRNPETGDWLKSPFTDGIVAIIFFGAVLPGLAYGVGARTIRNDAAAVEGMSKSMETLGVYIVLCFFAAQFVAYFRWTNLGLIFAIHGADLLRQSGLGSIPLMIAFVMLSATINLFMGSASAKWAVMAPVFIPMFMLLGYSPELVQATYRVGDSVSNVISPLMSYFPLILAFIKRYDPKAGIGTLIATMLPYTIAFFLVWIVVLVIWFSFSLPLGPGAPLMLE